MGMKIREDWPIFSPGMTELFVQAL